MFINSSLKALLIGLALLTAGAGNAVAGAFEDGQAAVREGNYAAAAKLWAPLAKRGNAEAQYNLGVLYDSGSGVPQNAARAAALFRKAALAGVVDAQVNLGVHYAQGLGVRKNPAQAAKWFRNAAALGSAQAKFDLGVLESAAASDAGSSGETASAAESAPSPAVGRWVQVGVFPSVKTAQQRQSVIQRRLGAEARERTWKIEPAIRDGKTFQRVLVGPFAGFQEAWLFCQKVSAIGKECMVR